jgi:hypothetical protein
MSSRRCPSGMEIPLNRVASCSAGSIPARRSFFLRKPPAAAAKAFTIGTHPQSSAEDSAAQRSLYKSNARDKKHNGQNNPKQRKRVKTYRQQRACPLLRRITRFGQTIGQSGGRSGEGSQPRAAQNNCSVSVSQSVSRWVSRSVSPSVRRARPLTTALCSTPPYPLPVPYPPLTRGSAIRDSLS